MTNPNNIAPKDFELWTGRISLERPIDPTDAQATITQYVHESRIPVVGYITEQPPAVTLLRWPDSREGYKTPTPPECDIALAALAKILNAVDIERDIIPKGKIHVMMGRKINGYDGDEEASIEAITRDLPEHSVADGHMVSARTEGRAVVPYGEKVGIIVVDPEHEATIHKLGDTLRQHHYAIERGPVKDIPGRVDFYETPWA
jgi:hypothetical protein